MVISQCSLLQLFGRRISQYRVFFLSPLILCTDYESYPQPYRLHWVLRSLHRELRLRFPVSHPFVPTTVPSAALLNEVSLSSSSSSSSSSSAKGSRSCCFRQRLLHTGALTKLPTRRPLKLPVFN